jgi:transposase
MTRKTFSSGFKHQAIGLVLEHGYSIQQACESVGVGPTALRRWIHQLSQERQGKTPVHAKAITPEHQRIQELEARIRQIEREKEILKKATALLMSDSLNQSR